MDNSDCYWYWFDVDHEYPQCCFDPNETQKCELHKPCMRYVAGDLVSDYLRRLISYNDFLEKSLALYEEMEEAHNRYLNRMEQLYGNTVD